GAHVRIPRRCEGPLRPRDTAANLKRLRPVCGLGDSMCLGSRPKPPPVKHSPPPPMAVPVVEDENVQRKRTRERQRAAANFGRESTILGAGGPTSQAKTLLGS